MQVIGISLERVRAVDRWLDAEVDTEYKNQPMAQDWARIAKVQEELGEAVRAFIGLTGQNPRKKKTHTIDELFQELADTAWTAILALQHFAKDDKTIGFVLAERFRTLYERMPKEYQT